jgi:hypothetical protein
VGRLDGPVLPLQGLTRHGGSGAGGNFAPVCAVPFQRLGPLIAPRRFKDVGRVAPSAPEPEPAMAILAVGTGIEDAGHAEEATRR